MRPARAKAQTKPRTPAVVGAPWVTSVSRSAGATMLSGRFRFVAALRPAMVAVQRPATKPLHTSGQQANAGISSPRHGGSLRVLRTAGRPRPTSRPGDRFKKVGWVLRGSFRDLQSPAAFGVGDCRFARVRSGAAARAVLRNQDLQYCALRSWHWGPLIFTVLGAE